MATRRWALALGLVGFGGALAFVLGLFSGAPDDAALTSYAVASFAVAAGSVVLAVRLILGRRRKGEDVEILLALLGAFLGGMLMAGFTEAFVIGISVAFHHGWGDREAQQFGGIDQDWRSWLSELQRSAPVVGGMIGAVLGFLGWGSRFTEMWSEPPAKFPPH